MMTGDSPMYGGSEPPLSGVRVQHEIIKHVIPLGEIRSNSEKTGGFGGFPGWDQYVAAREHALRGLRLTRVILYISHSCG